MLTVHSRPSQPKDRLIVSNIHRNGCKLSWQPPADDGGLPVEFVVEKFIMHANAWYCRYFGISKRAILTVKLNSKDRNEELGSTFMVTETMHQSV